MNSPWTIAYMNVLSEAQKFCNAWFEFRGNSEFTRELAHRRRKLEMTLAIYRYERGLHVIR